MIYSGETLSINKADNGVAHLVFDSKSGSVNKFDRLAVAEFTAALNKLEEEPGITGLIVSSAMRVFVVGADIGELTAVLDESADKIVDHLRPHNVNFRPITFEGEPS